MKKKKCLYAKNYRYQCEDSNSGTVLCGLLAEKNKKNR